MKLNMKTILSTIVLGSMLIAGSVNAESTCPTKDMLPLGLGDCKISTSYEEGTLGNITIGAVSGAVGIVSEDLADKIKNTAPQPDSVVTDVSAAAVVTGTIIGGGTFAVTKAANKVSKVADDIASDIANMATKQNEANAAVIAAMKKEEDMYTAMEKATKTLTEATDRLGR